MKNRAQLGTLTHRVTFLGRIIGLDVHKEVIFATILYPLEGAYEQYEFKADEFPAFLEKLLPHDQVALEATRGCRYYLKLLRNRVRTVVLANPRKLHFLTDAKNDRNDSLSLAALLSIGMLPAVWLPDDQTHQDREVLRHRSDLVKDQTRIKNRIRALLLDHGIQWEGSDVASKDARRFLFKIRTQLPASTQQTLGSCLEQLESLEGATGRVEDRIQLRADARRADMDLLMTIPGMGVLTALTILAEIGDIKRFLTSGSLVKYAGLVPTDNSSGGRPSKGRVTKAGNKRLRWAVTEVVQQLAQQPGTLRNFCRRLKNRKKENNGIPKAACARKLLEVVWHMLTKREVFHPLPGLTTDQVKPELVERKARRNQQRLELARARKEGEQERYRQAVIRQLSLVQSLATKGALLPLPQALRASYAARLSSPEEKAELQAAVPT